MCDEIKSVKHLTHKRVNYLPKRDFEINLDNQDK